MDYPPGKWTPYLIEPHWPHEASTEVAFASSRNRENIELLFNNYRIDLSNARQELLSEQEGLAANAARGAFQKDEQQADKVAEKNGIKRKSYGTAAAAFESLRQILRGVASDGNTAIDNILASKDSLDRVAEVGQVIFDSQTYSGHVALQHADQIKNAMQDVLTAQGDRRSPDQWAKDHGLDVAPPVPPNKEAITQQVKNLIESPPGSPMTPASHSSQSSAANSGLDEPNLAIASTPQGPPTVQNVSQSTSTQPYGGVGKSPEVAESHPLQSSSLDSGFPGIQTPGAIPVPPTAASVSPVAKAVAGGAGLTTGGFGVSAHGGGIPSATPSLSAPQALSPEGLAQSFNQGVHSGAPISTGSEALSQGVAHAAQSPVMQTHEFGSAPSTNVAPTIAPASGSHYAFDYPQTHSSDASSTYTPPADTASQMYAAPAAAAPAPPAAAMPTAPAGPLPTYGSDLRPPTPTPTVSTPLGPAAASPMSAPVNPSSGQSALGQPAVVKQQPVTPAGHSSAAGLTENAVAATATGAIAGAASEQSAAQSRLQSLVEVVARQEPQLRWAVGDRGDGTTILATDLACGWIPPHIEIPSGVTLLTPERRRGDFESLIGDTTNTATWTPGHYLPPEKDVDPVPTSFRARQVPDIDELNWELTQATNWRDGLPRLAHTLAKAGTAGTGVLDSETDLLHEHLTTIGQKVLKAYPYGVDAADVGNWQLLAAIDALLSGQRTNLNYHFAWFQALSMTTHGGVR